MNTCKYASYKLQIFRITISKAWEIILSLYISKRAVRKWNLSLREEGIYWLNRSCPKYFKFEKRF